MLKRGRVFTVASVPDAWQALYSLRSLIVNVITKVIARKRKARLAMALCIDLQAQNSRRNLLSRCRESASFNVHHSRRVTELAGPGVTSQHV